MTAGLQGKESRRDLEDLLRRALVPVEPDDRFLRRLKARLVRYSGSEVPKGWAVVGGLAIAVLVLLAAFSLAFRLFLELLGILGLLERRPALSGGPNASRIG
jgi:hypothetical protein